MSSTTEGYTEQVVIYSLNLTVTRPVRLYDDDSTLQQTAKWMAGPEAKRELEREVLQALRKLDGDCDIEVMDHRFNWTAEQKEATQ